MLAHRLRRWPNIETTLCECPVFSERGFHLSLIGIGAYISHTGIGAYISHTGIGAYISHTGIEAYISHTGIGAYISHIGIDQHTRDIHTMLFQCWHTVFDAGLTLKQCFSQEKGPTSHIGIGAYITHRNRGLHPT